MEARLIEVIMIWAGYLRDCKAKLAQREYNIRLFGVLPISFDCLHAFLPLN
jgi:hypothetical protein